MTAYSRGGSSLAASGRTWDVTGAPESAADKLRLNRLIIAEQRDRFFQSTLVEWGYCNRARAGCASGNALAERLGLPQVIVARVMLRVRRQGRLLQVGVKFSR